MSFKFRINTQLTETPEEWFCYWKMFYGMVCTETVIMYMS